MARITKVKTRPKGGETEILVLVNHPMETGNRKNKKTKKKIPAHYIQKMTFEVAGKQVAEANMGAPVSKNPLIGIRVKGVKKGAKVKISWSDNKGERGSAGATV
ncbi:MAG: thiosulfate oxidation carrier complex protein SoxZ [Gammaproteobacteria bacterium]|jgi:sulfur-oxidizing protein SoxZ|nr:MAG: thiosulfate oxidation carrier complex protein SoxZ [Gammaproteobacteria bacterium]